MIVTQLISILLKSTQYGQHACYYQSHYRMTLSTLSLARFSVATLRQAFNCRTLELLNLPQNAKLPQIQHSTAAGPCSRAQLKPDGTR